ncbi:MAG: tetratricopeptide repeat protein [Candidatus Gastranaerophilales bacterium]|nr:tetratricopeptide repeat protein [Candidatus Gastranaerophilales bacterium]
MKISKKLFLNLFLIVLLVATATTAFAADYSFKAIELYNQGLYYYQAKSYNSAIYSYKKALEIQPDFTDAYYNLGITYEITGQSEKAIQAYSAVLKINPYDYDAALELSKICYKRGNYQTALKYANLIPQSSQKSAEASKMKNDCNYAIKIQKERMTRMKSNVANPNKRVVLDKFASPTGIAVDSKGNVYVACFADSSIMKISPSKKTSLFVKSKLINGPIGMAIDRFDNLYIANYNNNNIIKVIPNGRVYIFMEKIYKPYYLHIKDDVLYISEQSSNVVMRYPLK